MKRKGLLKRLRTLYKELNFKDINLDENMSFNNNESHSIGLCSLNLITWFIKIEEEFKIEITKDDQYVKDIIDKIIRGSNEK